MKYFLSIYSMLKNKDFIWVMWNNKEINFYTIVQKQKSKPEFEEIDIVSWRDASPECLDRI